MSEVALVYAQEVLQISQGSVWQGKDISKISELFLRRLNNKKIIVANWNKIHFCYYCKICKNILCRERKKLRNQRNWRKKKKSSLVPISPFCNSCCPPFSIQLMDMCTIYQILVYVCLPFCQTDALNEQLTFSPFWNPVIRQSMEVIWLFQCILLIGHFYLSFLAFLWLPFNVKLLFAKFKKCLIDSVLYFSYFYTYIF